MNREEETHQFDWYIVRETDKARCFSETPDGADSFWVPRSLISNFAKYPAQPGELPMCLLEVPEWFAEKEGLL